MQNCILTVGYVCKHAITTFFALTFNCARIRLTANKIEDSLIDAIRSSILLYESVFTPSPDH